MASAKVRFPIGVKLILIISAIVIFTLACITFLVSYLVTKDIRITTEENNLTINSRTASECENRMESALSAVGILSKMLAVEMEHEQKNEMVSSFFEKYSDILAVHYARSKSTYINEDIFPDVESGEKIVSRHAARQSEYFSIAKSGRVALENVSPIFKRPVIAIFDYVTESRDEDVVVIYYSTESLFEGFSIGSVNQSFLLNYKGEILVHSDLDMTMRAADFSRNPVFLKAKDTLTDNMQNYFENRDKTEYIGAYKKLNGMRAAVITTVQLDVVLEGIRATTRRNIYLAMAILGIAVLIVWFFSRSISVPIRKLAAVTEEINNANFNTRLFDELETKRHDEIAILMESTQNERSILNMITSLTNIGVVRSIIRKEVDFDPHLKDITIFFSDIRGFTKISDEFNKRFGNNSGAEIIGFLNDYMSRMVQCITATGGVIDKFEGDAIMACWGVLRNDSLDFEKLPNFDSTKKQKQAAHERHKVEDALSAIKSTVAMRYALKKYNKDAEAFTLENERRYGRTNSKYKPEIHIGCGLNSGRATVGFMGSWEKLEFTSIGDPVNLASRTESSNKPCGTDILITEDTYNILKNDFIKCPENNFTLTPENEKNEIIVEKIPVAFEVKGKGRQHFYGVVNMPHFDVAEFFEKVDPSFVVDEECLGVVGLNGPKTLGELREILGIEEPDFGGVNLDEEENKIQVSGS